MLNQINSKHLMIVFTRYMIPQFKIVRYIIYLRVRLCIVRKEPKTPKVSKTVHDVVG